MLRAVARELGLVLRRLGHAVGPRTLRLALELGDLRRELGLGRGGGGVGVAAETRAQARARRLLGELALEPRDLLVELLDLTPPRS